jgi:lysophospholipid acyltransferase (LPLAT)-like uncharacterized protein
MKDISRRIAILFVPFLLYILMRFIWFTTRKSYDFLNEISEEQHICVTWHSELLMTPQAYRKIHPRHRSSAIISSHFNGALIAGVLKMIGIKALRGSSRRGAKQVLFQAFKSIKAGEEILITPDGPKGPRYSMSDGAVGIALKSNLPIFMINFKSSSYWQLKSWDKFIIPKPFSKLYFTIQSISLEGMTQDEAKNYLSKQMLAYSIR